MSQLDEATLQYDLAKLVAAGLLYQRGLPPEATYTFKHALIRDAAYHSLLRRTRQAYHQRIAETLEGGFAEIVERQPELIAYHLTAAGRSEQAIAYWQLAGDKAIERSAHAEAVAHLRHGLELIDTLPDGLKRAERELALHVSLAAPLVALQGQSASEIEQVYMRACELSLQVGDTSQLISVLWGLYRWYGGRAQYERARAIIDHIMRLAEELRDPTLYAAAHRALGAHAFHQGELLSARSHLEQAIALYAPTAPHAEAFYYATDHGVTCRMLLSWTLWALGYSDQAAAQSQDMLALARKLPHLPTLAFALLGAASLQQLRRDAQATVELAEELIALASEQGFAYCEAVGRILQGWTLSATASQGAKSLELRAATSLARLWRRRGKREEARRLLSDVDGWFTEGFDTVDRRAAKALLDELTTTWL